MSLDKSIVENYTLVTMNVVVDDREMMYRIAKEWNRSRSWLERVGFTIPGHNINVPAPVINEWKEYWNTCKRLREL